MESPCVDICTLDARGEICTGCWRTLDEIVAWARLTPDQRRAIMADLPARAEAGRPSE